MLKIRRGVFETNSSSVHSVVIANHAPKDERDYNRYYAEGSQYGRYSTEVCDDIASRLDYLWQIVLDNEYRSKDADDAFSTEWWREAIMEVLPEATLIEDYDNGYIDHGSDYEELLEEMRAAPELIAMFLLNDDSRVFMKSDEDDIEFDYPDCDYIEFHNE